MVNFLKVCLHVTISNLEQFHVMVEPTALLAFFEILPSGAVSHSCRQLPKTVAGRHERELISLIVPSQSQR
jgi:hypothetical protein